MKIKDLWYKKTIISILTLITLAGCVIYFAYFRLSDSPEDLIDLLSQTEGDDWSAGLAYEKLLAMEERSLPALIFARSNDTRIATGRYQGIYSIRGKARVSNVCYEIISQMVGFRHGKLASFCGVFPRDLELWYEQRKDWSLDEIRVELYHARIMEIETGERVFPLNTTEEEVRMIVREFQGKIQKIGKSGGRKGYAWQEPTNLSEEQVLKIAEQYLSDKNYKLNNQEKSGPFYSHSGVPIYEHLLDDWNISFGKDISSDKIYKFHFLQLTIDDTNSSVKLEEWEKEFK